MLKDILVGALLASVGWLFYEVYTVKRDYPVTVFSKADIRQAFQEMRIVDKNLDARVKQIEQRHKETE